MKPVRGLDWGAIFREHPELSPPGYEDAVRESLKKAVAKKRAKLEAQQAKGKK